MSDTTIEKNLERYGVEFRQAKAGPGAVGVAVRFKRQVEDRPV